MYPYLSKSSMHIIQIVPRLPPAIDGVGDYAYCLARQMRQDFGIQTYFIGCDPNGIRAADLDGFPVSWLDRHSAFDLFSLLKHHPGVNILLHYVGYGYAKRGCPTWLVNALDQWHSSNSNARLVTMFHEVYASGPPWSSSFWLSSLQKQLATRLARLSDHCVTSKDLYAKILQQMSQGKHTQISALPVFSTIGEPEQVLQLQDRDRQLVIFGRPGNRLQVYQSSLKKLTHICENLNIQKVLDIGAPIGQTPSSVSGVPIIKMGSKTAAQLSNLFSTSIAGFLDYNSDYLGKSTIFAAYCAYGMLPISAQCSTQTIDGIVPGKHYWFLDQSQTDPKNWAELQAIADNAHFWYQTHSLSIQTKVFVARFAG
ncbi:glycosyltransferase family 1 protein [Lyngbya confervoides]|uniref:Glycosyltransferase family 1 protein n=1 Tax=Lyngbya confervoides BDU141951 TaxID=1574623 RepID=A0ABD4T813_9CYAN|nr:glycosyltransferase family 1 protein [Lyngbya confervoides]MCM1984608.1 glycosyltransferase family 1 protein [Lyngbya confervoides BDU141951]